MSDDLRPDDGQQLPLTSPDPVAAAPQPAVEPPAAPPPPPPPPAAPRPQPGYAYGPPIYQVAPATRRGPSAVRIILLILVIGGGLMMIGGLFSRNSVDMSAIGGDKVGVIAIEGVIRDGGKGGLFSGPAGARGIMAEIRQAAKDDEVKSVLLLINSPGGSAAASNSIYRELQALRAKKKVVACMTDVAASGGYYIASGCDKIVAEGATLTGSIGVIFGGVGYYGLMKKYGVTDETQKAGLYKDMGSPMRPMTAAEKGIIQGLLNDVYGQFIQAVAEGRKMKVAQVRSLAEGRIYTGAQAKRVGLVDQLGSYYDALKLAAELGKIKGEPKVKRYGEDNSLFGGLTGESLVPWRHLGGQAGLGQDWTLEGPMLLTPFAYRALQGEQLLPVR